MPVIKWKYYPVHDFYLRTFHHPRCSATFDFAIYPRDFGFALYAVGVNYDMYQFCMSFDPAGFDGEPIVSDLFRVGIYKSLDGAKRAADRYSKNIWNLM